MLVLVSQLRIEILREVQVTLHVIYFTIPEVKLISLLRVVLLHESHAPGHVLLLSILFFDGAFKGLNSILQGLLVSIEGCAE